MLTRVCLSFAFLVTVPAWSQVAPAATGGVPDDETQMRTPPPVSVEPIPTFTGSEARSNYLDPGLTFETSYNDNLLGGSGILPISDMAYSVYPRIEFDKMTPRLHQTWRYEPRFTLYQHTGARNEADQNVSLDLTYRLSQHMTISGRDAFHKLSNVFNQPDSLLGGASSAADVVVPFGDRLSNEANAQLSYQYSANGMIGGGGTTTMLTFPNQTSSSDLADSNSNGGSVFLNRRLTSTQYTGATYRYSRDVDSRGGTQTNTRVNTFNFFYTLYLMHVLTLSVAGGPQRFEVAQPPFPPSASWTPAVTGSAAWQGDRVNCEASYSRSVAGGGGLLGAFHSNSANVSARWRLARTWTLESAGSYTLRKNVSALSFFSEPGGHFTSETVSIEHSFGERIKATLGYQRLHQIYDSIAEISGDPDSDRESISISYQFRRPLGR
jgi:hypothetical protein